MDGDTSRLDDGALVAEKRQVRWLVQRAVDAGVPIEQIGDALTAMPHELEESTSRTRRDADLASWTCIREALQAVIRRAA